MLHYLHGQQPHHHYFGYPIKNFKKKYQLSVYCHVIFHLPKVFINMSKCLLKALLSFVKFSVFTQIDNYSLFLLGCLTQNHQQCKLNTG